MESQFALNFVQLLGFIPNSTLQTALSMAPLHSSEPLSLLLQQWLSHSTSRRDAQVVSTVYGMLSTALSLRPQGQERSTEEQGVLVTLPTPGRILSLVQCLQISPLMDYLLSNCHKASLDQLQQIPKQLQHSTSASLQTFLRVCVVCPV